MGPCNTASAEWLNGAVAAFDTWGTAVRVLLAELEAADARLHGGAPEQLPRGVATAAL